MSSQPPSSLSLQPGLQNHSPPSFATFTFSPGFGGSRAQTHQNLGRPRTLTERMGLGPRVIPLKRTSTPLAGPSSSSTVQPPPMLDTEMLDTSIDGGEQPQTNPFPAPSVDIQTPNSAAELSSQERESPPDIWGYAKLVQDEWASVERPSLPTAVHQAMESVNIGDNTRTGVQRYQKVNKPSALYPDDRTLPPNGPGQRGTPHPSISSSHGPEIVKKEGKEVKVKQEEEVKIKREELEPSLLCSKVPSLVPPVDQRQPKREPNPIMTAGIIVKKEGPSDQYFEATEKRVQPSTTENPPQQPPLFGKLVEGQISDFSQAKNAAESQVSGENGTLKSVHYDTRIASSSRTGFRIEEPTIGTGGNPPVTWLNSRAAADFKSAAPRVHHTPLQGTSTSQPLLPVLPPPPLAQTVNQQATNEPIRMYQGNTHRESASIPTSGDRLKPSIGYTTHLGTGRNSSVDGPHDASGKRGCDFTGPGLSTLPSRPLGSTEGYCRYSPTHSNSPPRHYSPKRGNSSPRHSDHNFEGRSITHAPPRAESIRHRPRRPSPHTPPPRTPPRSRSPPRRTSDTYNHQNERRDDFYRPARSRSRSPPRRRAEREYAPAQLSPRGPKNGDMRRGHAVTYPAHNSRPRSEWRTPAKSFEPYRKNFEDPYLTRPPEGLYDSYRPTQPVPSRQPTRNEHDSYRPHRGSPGSDRQSPMSAGWEKRRISPGGNTRRANSRGVSDPETSRRSSSIEEDVHMSPHTEPQQGLKRRRAEDEEPQAELEKQSPVPGPEPAAKRRRIDEEDNEMEASLSNPGKSYGMLGSILPTNASLIASAPATKLLSLEEYPSLPPLILTGNRNRLLMRMEGNNHGFKLSQPVSNTHGPTSLTSTPGSSDDPDDVFRRQNMLATQNYSLATRETTDNTNPSVTARVPLKDRFHHNQSQNDPQSSHSDLTLPSTSNTPIEDLGKPPSRRASGSKPAPPQRASISGSQKPTAALLGRIDLNQTSVSQLGDHVVEVLDPRGPRQPRPHVSSGNDQDISQPLEARLGLRADEVAPYRPRQGSKAGRGGASSRAPGGDLAARLD